MLSSHKKDKLALTSRAPEAEKSRRQRRWQRKTLNPIADVAAVLMGPVGDLVRSERGNKTIPDHVVYCSPWSL